MTIDADQNSISASETPCLTPDQLVITGRLKTEPDDFIVEEIPAYSPSGEGDHLYLWIEKRDISADYLTGHLARSLRVKRDDIGMAGLKDRRAITRQWVSVPGSAEANIDAVNTDAIRVLETSRHTNKLKTGHLKGNRFEIVLRDTPPEQFKIAQDLVDLIAVRGVPNYFGEQRFGIDGETLSLGIRLLKGEADPRDIPGHRRKFLLRLAASAVQSSFFNAILAQRLLEGWLHQVQVGDVMQVCASGGPFVVEDATREQTRFDSHETVITGPIFGPKMKAPSGRPAELEQRILDAAGFTHEIFRAHSKLTPGTRRPLLLWPGDLKVEKHPLGLKLNFELPSGSYATVVLNEFLKQSRT